MRKCRMEIQWAVVLPPLSIIATILVMWWKLDSKIEGVRKASESAHKSIRDDLCDLKVTAATIKTDVEWLKRDRNPDKD